MDPKSIANLDPKLRETYERVMGTSGSAGANPAAPSTSPENQAAPLSATPSGSDLSAAPVPPPPDFSTPVSPEPQLSSPLSAPNGSQSLGANIPSSTPYSPADLGLSSASQPSQGDNSQALSSPATVAQTTQGSSSLAKILYIFGGIVFFIVYVFFWIKIFNYQLPF